MNIVALENVTKTFGSLKAVDELSLSVPKGSVYGFIGPNGSGKTTTLRMIMHILYPDSGSIRIFGERIHKTATDRIGYMPEERGVYTRMKLKEALLFYGKLKNGKNIKNEVDMWLEKLELTNWANQKVAVLSKGMMQKVQFIATIIAHPELVILDEPFTGLDPVNTDIIKDAVLQLQREGMTIIFSTHDMNVAEKMCDFIFMICKGKKVLDGTLTSIQDKYGSDTIRIRKEGGNNVYHDIRGIEKVNDFGQQQELRISPDFDPQEIMMAIMSRARVKSFDVVKPSLHDIFVRIAAPEKGENHVA